nr:odorant receptor 46a-like [Vanessa tameamea]
MVTEIEIKMPEKKFKSFNETFPHCAFALAIALIYPNRSNARKRMMLFGVVTLINSVVLFWFLLYLAKCVYTLDMYNLSRNVSIGILASLFFFKSFYGNWKTDIFAQLLEKITDDLLKGNDMDEDEQEIYEYYIKLGKLGQTCWIIIPILLSSQFPIYAGVCMIYERLKSDVGKKYMIHEMELKFIEDKQYESPYFELMFAYNLVQCVVLSPNFAGFDGSFCIATNHLRLKLKLYAHKVNKAFKNAKTRDELELMMKDAIRDNQEALLFYNDLQEVYGGWLFTVFLFTSLLISMNLYQIYLSRRVDPKYTIFALSGVIHMFTPCYFSSNLIKTSEELSWDLYNSAWEAWADPAVTKLLIFMIAKSQQTLILTGKGMVYFNMQLFISVLQTSYSFFTLISS